MKKTKKMYMREFEEKYQDLEKIDSQWYERELGVKAFAKSSNLRRKDGTYTEEWYRAKFTYMMVKSGLYNKENLCIELSLPKGNGGKAIKPDIVAFKDKKWLDFYNKNEIDELRKYILVVFEAKDNSSTVEKAIQKQIEVALERRITSNGMDDCAYGVYFDNKDDIVIVKKQGLSELERYDTTKMIESSKNIVRLNVADRDDLEKLPGLEELIDKIKKAKMYQYSFDNLEEVTPESFKTIMEYVKRAKDKIQYPNVKQLLVESLKLKVYDETNIKETKGLSNFFIADKEVRENGYATSEFRKRVFELYEGAREMYDNLGIRYLVDPDTGDLSPINPEDEKMMIEIFRVLQGKGLIKGKNNNFNQTIFNNFGDEVEKSVAGQFFTPIPIIEAICKMVNQREDEDLMDPSSGICDFHTIAYKVAGNKIPSSRYYGVDISTPVLNLAELNLVLNGIGSINLARKNSIYEKRCVDGSFTDINTFTPNNYDIRTWKHKDDRRKSIGQYTIGTTNPPFGKGRDLKTGKDGVWDFGLTEDNMRMYETWTLLGNPKSIDMGILFLENIYKITKPGGRFAIVLSNSIASIDSWSKVRMWLMERVRLVALIDLPQNSFGETGVATTVIIAYKPKESEKKSLLAEDYEVFAREIKYIGYEVQTVQRNIVFEPIKEYDPITFEDKGKLKEDFTEMLADFNEYMKSQNGIIKRAFGR